MLEIKNEWAFSIPGKLEIPYRYFAGAFQSKALVALRDKKKIMGSRCPKCRKVFFPPRSNCEVCLSKISDLVEIGPEGTLISWTVVNYREPIHTRRKPYILGLIKPDGADSAMLHFIAGIEPEKLKQGMRLKPVFSRKRAGQILDIKHFKPVI